jgi:hypothetical protein
MKDFPPRVKKRIREYSMQAHENELKIALAELAPKFKAWEAGQMGSGELSDIVFRWANGINKELFKKYNYGMTEMNVAYAIVTGLLDRASIDQEVLEYLNNAIAFYERNRE